MFPGAGGDPAVEPSSARGTPYNVPKIRSSWDTIGKDQSLDRVPWTWALSTRGSTLSAYPFLKRYVQSQVHGTAGVMAHCPRCARSLQIKWSDLRRRTPSRIGYQGDGFGDGR